MKQYHRLLSLLITFMLLAGCNIFQFTAAPTSAADYITSGREKINDGDYEGALSDFTHAMEEDELNSEARYLHAKATLLNSGFNVINVITEMSDTNRFTDSTIVPLPFFDWEPEPANRMYQANVVIHVDLEPIKLLQTHGPIVYNDIKYDYTLAVLIEAILSLRDTNGDGYIDENDINLNFLWGPNGLELDLEELWDLLNEDPGAINNLLGGGLDLMRVALLLFPDLFGEDSPYDTAELDSLMNEIADGLEIFFIDDGEDNDGDWFDTNEDGEQTPMEWTDLNWNGTIDDDSGVPLPWHYDGPYTGEFTGGDYGVDEEEIDGFDNDGDTIVDEDSHSPQ